MKIAEALIERKRIQQLMESNKQRVVSQAHIYEGDETVDDVVALINELRDASTQFEDLTRRINKTNQSIQVRKEKNREEWPSIADLIARKDSLAFYKNKLDQIYKAGAEKIDRYGRSEAKVISTVDLTELRRVINNLTTELNALNVELQRYNWTYDLLD